MSVLALAFVSGVKFTDPVLKLAAIYLADRGGIGKSWCSVSSMMEWCLANDREPRAILYALHELGVVHSWSIDGDRLSVMPGWLDVPTIPLGNDNNGVASHLREKIFRRDGFICHYCGTMECDHWEIDHVVPVSIGGTDDLNNLVVSCRDCNRAKGARTPEEWKNEQSRL